MDCTPLDESENVHCDVCSSNMWECCGGQLRYDRDTNAHSLVCEECLRVYLPYLASLRTVMKNLDEKAAQKNTDIVLANKGFIVRCPQLWLRALSATMGYGQGEIMAELDKQKCSARSYLEEREVLRTVLRMKEVSGLAVDVYEKCSAKAGFPFNAMSLTLQC